MQMKQFKMIGYTTSKNFGMTKFMLQMTTQIRLGCNFSTVIILHNRVRKEEIKSRNCTRKETGIRKFTFYLH